MTSEKILYAVATVLCYALMCAAIAWQYRSRQRAAQRRVDALLPATPGVPAWWVAYASQTGQAEELALQTAQALHTAGVPVRLAPLSQISLADLQQADRLLCIASTYGEGDPPDSAVPFARQVMATAGASLSHLHVGLLALGDKTYANYCGFGRALDQWLLKHGAHALFERIDVDKSDPEALQRWRHHLGHLAGTNDLPDWEAPALQAWRLRSCTHLNPGSAGEPVHHLALEPAPGLELPDWQAGDLAQVEVPTAPGEPRDYSIASVPQDGAVHLLVRQTRREDGSPGLASGWLTQVAQPGDTVMLRVRAHSGFRIGDNANRALILIGNGTGLAGLRGHMRGRLAAAAQLQGAVKRSRPEGVAPMWLLFGERNADRDAHYRDEIDGWAREGWLSRVDWVFSRDQAERRYVQHALADAAEAVREWVEQGAAIYVCGSLEGMAAAVNDTLQTILGEETLQQLAAQGRYRRDVY
ncbi:sulfite reductase subunit alpha [Hydrogenophaga sp.]|uniref:sulfite reductase subunit alpha n=1 Tax=Hydrogenophaga sp. TaxID=1904254 RepID=UPI00271843F1|nr:sulfite reductase subunit alpha [Hydrogenophaga sp.]MDO9434521.1 sulfite reductase subunit alpha [Hydrogenophaga sp.]